MLRSDFTTVGRKDPALMSDLTDPGGEVCRRIWNATFQAYLSYSADVATELSHHPDSHL